MKENTEKRYNKFLWVELYRPQTVSDILMPVNVKKQFMKMVKDKSIPNLLLYSSSPGVGKCLFKDEEIEIEIDEEIYLKNRHLFND